MKDYQKQFDFLYVVYGTIELQTSLYFSNKPSQNDVNSIEIATDECIDFQYFRSKKTENLKVDAIIAQAHKTTILRIPYQVYN
eukprot:CAMPEP_0170553526 /NCGR_PEP_ID=MMETSP0211-20121228/11355_1 /TAXON_ID=311385 /ORGANISM="Pseudokeronopsis sp., Strain OXSARD2" /LENGTH=82 /DNA_ID=CAMNT_0010861921 /DNA_START=196 /DNA_END=444 /DNA_ORIENTATION=-